MLPLFIHCSNQNVWMGTLLGSASLPTYRFHSGVAVHAFTESGFPWESFSVSDMGLRLWLGGGWGLTLGTLGILVFTGLGMEK